MDIYEYGLNPIPTNLHRPQAEQIVLCEQWLGTYGISRKSLNTAVTSYGLKHMVERWCGKYVSNGAFIQAAINLGYNAKRCYPGNPNVYINISSKSLKEEY